MNINGKEETEDMYSAIDMVLDKLEKQIKKNKQKFRERRGAKVREKEIPASDLAGIDEDTPEKLHIRNIEYKPMDVEEAIMQMDLVDQNFMVFTNARTDRVNVIYRRNDGGYGLIQPSS